MIIEIVALKSSVSGCKISFVSHGSYFQQSSKIRLDLIDQLDKLSVCYIREFDCRFKT